MTVTLSTLHSAKGARRSRRRVGRGHGSGRGTYSGRGVKGQGARSGGRHKGGHQGKRMPAFLYQMPKSRGFQSIHPKNAVVHLAELERAFDAGSVVTLDTLRAKKLIPRTALTAKVLGTGSLTKKLTLRGVLVSATARAAVEKVGGHVDVKLSKQKEA